VAKFVPDNFLSDYVKIGDINQEINSQNKYKRFDEIDNILKKQYYNVSGIDLQKMVISAAKAYVDSIDDPYTVYMDAEENSGFMEDLE
jgi:C-terminal processing protease CtpA/Prc